jgi:drug/metabolite transporter (DMT)-like permease
MWGIADFMGGNLTKRYPVRSVVWLSQVAGLTAISLVGFVQGFEFSAQVLLWGSIASITGYIGLMAFYKALSIGMMGIVSPIAALGVLVPLGLGLFKGDVLTGLQFMGIVLAVIGIVLASGPEVSGLASAKPVWLALLAALGFGLCLAAIAEGSSYDALSTMTVMRIQTVSLGALLWLRTRDQLHFAKNDRLPLITIGIFDIGANLAFGLATTGTYLSLVSVLGSVYPVFTVLLAWWILKERLLSVQYVGVLLALVGVGAIAGG